MNPARDRSWSSWVAVLAAAELVQAAYLLQHLGSPLRGIFQLDQQYYHDWGCASPPATCAGRGCTSRGRSMPIFSGESTGCRMLGVLRRKGLLTPERITLMRSWAHSGFVVSAQVRIIADDALGRENLARYPIRAPFSMNKIRYDSAARTVLYKTKMIAGANRNFEIFDPLDFLAVVTSHIPNRG